MGQDCRPDTSLPDENQGARSPWLFSPAVDLVAFVGSAGLALFALCVGGFLGLLDQETPHWAWIPAVLLIDVAHVYSTAFRVYFDPAERRRRPWLYSLTPVAAFAVAWALYSESPELFWRSLAYLAVFHFVRQQYGWVALYRAKGGESSRWGRAIDSAAIYLATIYPLVYWQTHLPRHFWWFKTGDFASLPEYTARLLFPIYVAALSLYALRSLWRMTQGQFSIGKDCVVATTACCWYLGIVQFNSDYAFTVTNVIIHGVPYAVLVYWYRFARSSEHSVGRHASRIALFVGVIWALAFAEELLWDRFVWHERSWLFGEPAPRGFRQWLVPLLAVPQMTHYLLDGFIWRRRSNPDLQATLADSQSPEAIRAESQVVTETRL